MRQKAYAILSVGLTDGVLHGWLATFIYVRLRNARLAARALADAQIRRSEANRRLVAARLQSTHVQVDPTYVIDRLDAIARLYELDSSAADAQLDELISFLRGAIPRLRHDAIAGEAA
jgi:LytS/YehU family sensor histidine kinase